MCGSGHALWLLTRVIDSLSRGVWAQVHTSSVRALAWCSFQSNLLASGCGEEDRKIKFWNTQTGACLNSVDTGSFPPKFLLCYGAARKESCLAYMGLSSHCGIPETVRIPVTKAARGPFSHVARIETVKASLQGKPLIDN
ncbi:hypothetical protein IGI04_033869 [Brassica rapa subsp. trilocularis]|uniref:Anaphase-promoting complex subunit 4 WD40 domain-containing protein n=1 Tax=Brassica rapa subsp. trilocularis TaxID=1813537 RepID=A0ABQ7L726_BRACM|nr:hypothetical protein IGI04_033869 [Brassica rapa subsp. trilocularis]